MSGSLTIVMPRWLRSLLLLVLAASPPLYVLCEDEPAARHAKEAGVDKLIRSNRQLRSDVGELRRRIGALRDDPRFLERVAREELGWIRDGETVYRVSSSIPTPPADDGRVKIR